MADQGPPPLRQDFDLTDPKFKRQAAALYPRKVVDDIAGRHQIGKRYKGRLRKALVQSGRLYLIFREHEASGHDKRVIKSLKRKVAGLLSDIESANENTRYELHWGRVPEALHDTQDRLSALLGSRGRPSAYVRRLWVHEMAVFWVNILGRKFTIDSHQGTGITTTYSFLKDAFTPLDPNTGGLLTAARHVRTERRRLTDK